MKEIHLNITQESPLLLGNASGPGFYQETRGYIPGSALRGAVAGLLLQSCMDEAYMKDHRACPDKATCPFWQVFGGETAHEPLFSDGYAAKLGPAYPFPITARTCKRYPGFPSDNARPCDEHHSVFDTLIQQFVYELVSDPQFPHRAELLPELGEAWAQLPGRYDPHCPECDKSITPAEGFYAAPGGKPGYAHQPTIGRATHVGINRDRGVAEDAILFTQESIQPAEKVSYWARVVLDPTYEPTLVNALAEVRLMGRGQSRGMGEVSIKPVGSSTSLDVSGRLELFDAALKKELARYQAVDERVTAGEGTYFSLTLRADALLTHDGLPASRPDPDDLGLPADVIRVRSWARTTTIGGWNSAATLPYRTRQGVNKGAAYLFYAPAGVDQKALNQRLSELDQVGIGDDRERGHGQVTVCAPFHYKQIV